MGLLKNITIKKPRKLKPIKPRTQLIDPKLPRGKVGKGPLEPRDSTTRVFMDPMKRIKSNMAERPKKDNPASSYGGNATMGLNKGPGMKTGGTVVKAYKDGGGVCAGASNNRRSRQGAEIVK
jgi:hypothetical protein